MHSPVKILIMSCGLLCVPLLANAQANMDDELLGGPLRTPPAPLTISEDASSEAHTEGETEIIYEEITYIEADTLQAGPALTISEQAAPAPTERRLNWQGRNNY